MMDYHSHLEQRRKRAQRRYRLECAERLLLRVIKIAVFVAVVSVALLMFMGASYRTPNFVVQTQDRVLAQEFCSQAESLRAELAQLWLGRTLPQWSRPCPVTVRVGPGLGAGGATMFVFNEGEVFGWRMTIRGSRQRVLDSVLPHEITHMVFASHFRQPVPRWASEGAATSAERQDELIYQRKNLVKFLTTGRGIAFNRMFSMVEYPRDIMPLYAQGYTLCEFLIQQGGRRKFVNYLRDGLVSDQWGVATQAHYGYGNLGELQNDWVAWVGNGFPGAHSGVMAAVVRDVGSRAAGDQVVISGYG